MSATPEQIADWLMIGAVGDAANEHTNRADHMRAAAALIRAQAERVRVLESVFGHYHVGPGDKCGRCGLDLRDRVHTRAVQS